MNEQKLTGKDVGEKWFSGQRNDMCQDLELKSRLFWGKTYSAAGGKQARREEEGTRSMRWEAVKSQRALSVTVLIKNVGLHSERKGKPLMGHSRISQWQERQEGLQRHRSSKLSSKLNQVSEEKSTGGFQFRANVQLSYRSLIFIPHRLDTVFYSTEQKWCLCSLRRRETAYLWTAGLRKKD